MTEEEYKNTIKIQFQMINELTEKIDKAIEYNNYLLEHCRYKLNDGHLKKMNKILGAKQQEEYRLTKDENGTTQINGEWYKVEKIK